MGLTGRGRLSIDQSCGATVVGPGCGEDGDHESPGWRGGAAKRPGSFSGGRAGPARNMSEVIKDEHTSLSTVAFFRKLAFYFRAHKWQVVLILLACSLETSFYWIVPLAFRHLIDNTLATADHRSLVGVLSALGAGTVVASIASLWRSRYWARLENQVVSDIRFQLFNQLQRLSMSFYAKTSTGDLLSHFSNDLSAVANALTMTIVWGVLPGLD